MAISGRFIFIGLFLLTSVSFAQLTSAPHLATKDFKKELNRSIFILSVIDTTLFKNSYRGKLPFLERNNNTQLFRIRLNNLSELEELKKDVNVIFIDQHQRPREEAIVDFLNWSFNRVTKARHHFPDINGANLSVSIKEQAFDPTDINLINRSFTTSVTPTISSQHATNMTTLIGGGGNTSPQALGAAFKARFTSSDFNNLLPDNSSIFNENNILVQNHSYGIGIENYYGNEASAYDQQVYDNPFILHIFSSGNSGKSKPLFGTYQNLEWANLTGNFKQSKNVLVVNAVDTSLTVNALNSRGPAFDGRLKPELTAFGQGGTSEAAAVVSGISLLIQEKYHRAYQKWADASMVKAILIASADNLGEPGIDYLYGYGNVNAFKALTLIESAHLETATLLENDIQSIPIDVSATVSEIKIAISWTDPAATPNSSNVLVNDIDSWLSNGNEMIYPWVLSTYPSSDSLASMPKRKPDHLNNTEYITITNPTPGTYQLFLKSGTLKNAEQKVSVAWWMNNDKQFDWDFPVQGDLIEGGRKNLLVWESKANQQGDLSFQINDADWQPIQQGADLNGSFYWLAPDTLSNAKLKMTIGSIDFITEQFLITPSLKIKSAFNCMDSIGLTWNSIDNATGYELYTMGSQYLQKIETTQDTLIVLPQSNNKFFSVTPVFFGNVGAKSETININQQGANCYLNLFAAERFNKELVRIQLSLSSYHLIDRIVVYKTTEGIKSIYQNIKAGNLLDLEFYDPELVPGLMVYQSEIIFKDGSTFFSDPVEITIEEKNKAIIYPNPVSDNDYLTVLSSGDEVRFQILDVFGRTLFEKEINIIADDIDVLSLPKGVYFYRLISKENITDTGRFIKK